MYQNKMLFENYDKVIEILTLYNINNITGAPRYGLQSSCDLCTRVSFSRYSDPG